MSRDTTDVEHEIYGYTSNIWSQQNSNKWFKEKFGSYTRKTFSRFTTKDNYTLNITCNMESIAVWNLKPEQWGSPLVQEKSWKEKACDKRHNNNNNNNNALTCTYSFQRSGWSHGCYSKEFWHRSNILPPDIYWLFLNVFECKLTALDSHKRVQPEYSKQIPYYRFTHSVKWPYCTAWDDTARKHQSDVTKPWSNVPTVSPTWVALIASPEQCTENLSTDRLHCATWSRRFWTETFGGNLQLRGPRFRGLVCYRRVLHTCNSEVGVCFARLLHIIFVKIACNRPLLPSAFRQTLHVTQPFEHWTLKLILTPWIRVLLEKLVVAQLLKTFPKFD